MFLQFKPGDHLRFQGSLLFYKCVSILSGGKGNMKAFGNILIGALLFLGCHSVWSEDLGQFRNTHYYVAMEKDYPLAPRNQAILNMRGEVLVMVSPEFKRAVDIEGTGRLLDGRVFNFAGRVPDGIRYLFVEAQWGMGVGSCRLEPFRSVAVDPEKIPLGSMIEIAETKGMLLPDGSVHDGLWRAEDVGSAIKKDRVDLFIGEKIHARFLEAMGITYLSPLTIRMVSDPPADSCARVSGEESGNDSESQ